MSDALNILSKAGLDSQMAQNSAGVRDFSSSFAFNPNPNLSTTPLDQTSNPDIPQVTQLLPQYRTTATNKWNQIQSSGILNKYNVPTVATNTVIDMDKQRLDSGKPPLTMSETLQAIKAAHEQHPVTNIVPRQVGDVLGNAWKDAGNILNSIVRFPQAVGQELMQIPQIPKVWDQQNTSFGQKVHETPILNLIPGVNTAANLTEGQQGLHDIATHPLMTALDILPLAAKGAEFTPAGGLAEDLRSSEGTTSGVPRPLKAAALYRVADVPALDPTTFEPILDENGQQVVQKDLVRNPVGQFLFKQATENPLGSAISERFGGMARNMTYKLNRLAAGVAGTQAEGGRAPEWAGLAGELSKNWADLNRQYDLTPQERVLANQIGRVWDPGDPNQAAVLDANPKIASYLDDARTQANALADFYAPPIESIINLRGDLPAGHNNLLASYQGEVYTPEQAQKMVAMQKAAERAEGNLSRVKAGANGSILTRLIDLGSEPGADPRILDVAQHIQDGNFAEAKNLFSTLTAKKVGLGTSEVRQTNASTNPNDLEFPLPGGQVQIREAANIKEALKDAVKKRQKYEDVVGSTPPARYGDWIVSRVGQTVQANLADNPAVNAEWLTHVISDNDWGALVKKGLVSQDELNAIAQDVGNGWQQAKAGGIDPIFNHHVSASSVPQMAWPRVLPQKTDPTFAMERAWSFQPYVQDYGVGLNHIGMELVKRAGQEQAIDYLVRNYGVTQPELEARYQARIDKQPLYSDTRLGGGETQATQDVLSKGWGRFDPEGIVGYRSARWADLEGKDVWIPKPVLRVIEAMKAPVTDNLMTKVTDPVMAPFRASVLTLSPRFLANTLLGGAIEAGVSDPAAFRPGIVKKAWDLVRGNTDQVTLGKGDYRTDMYMPDDFQATQNQSRLQQQELNNVRFRVGRQFAKWWNDSQSRYDTVDMNAVGDKMADAGQATKKIWNAPLQIHNFAENMYRAAAYLSETDRSLRKGMDPDVAMKEGVRAMEKVLPQWEALTPFERGIVRSVFPFYTWTQHILSFAMNLPLDHPTRVAVVSNLVRTQLDDEKTGWPSLFRSMLLLGHPDTNGDQSAIQLNGGNPFRDVGNFLTLQGFMAGVNPVISTALEGLGVKQGAPDIYANTSYNPTTGKMEVDTGNPLLNLIHNTIPQSDWIAQKLGQNEEFDQMLKSNPDAAQRRALSDLGLPTFYKTVNLPHEAATREVTIYKAMMADKSAGLKAGNLNQVAQWPDQKAYVKQLLSLSPAQLQRYEPSANGPPPSQSSPSYSNQVSALSVTPHPLGS